MSNKPPREISSKPKTLENMFLDSATNVRALLNVIFQLINVTCINDTTRFH